MDKGHTRESREPATTPRSPEWNYERHRAGALTEKDLPVVFSAPDSIGAWQHNRMYRLLLPLVTGLPDATWLTIGDGNYGCDAHFLKSRNISAVASNITDNRLRIAKDRGLIDDYRVENAEQLSLPDESFDFVMCKSSYHHFPRPPVAFYEMLRVARQAVVLIEPQESGFRPLSFLKNLVKRLVRGGKSPMFEPVAANFIFRINIREMRKMLTAMNHEALATRRFNDFACSRFLRSKHSRLSLPSMLTRLAILVQDLLCAAGLLDHGLICAVAFKRLPPDNVRRGLRRAGFRLHSLPRNPYISG